MQATSQWHSQRWLVGAVLIAIGALLLLMNIGLIERFSLWRFWPLILIAAGISRLMASKRAEGFWLLTLGLWFQISLLHLWGLSFGETWPAILIAFGVFLIWDAAEKQARQRNLHQKYSVSQQQPM